MSEIAIRVEGLGKEYRLGQRERYQTFRDHLTRLAAAPFRALQKLIGPASPALGNGETRRRELFWALKDVSFDVNRGEVIGIIGRNGAGKSTLLKILSRITEPTTGEVEIAGRVGSLLEVGTGFHPELTGRENIFLNGAILGMRRAEMHRKLDQIIEFAEIAEFLDTPVKHYSSGMQMRLAFAVAAHLEPEILIVDEVLAVGDLAFQKKCLGRMEEVVRQGRTVLFVSHNMSVVQQLCTRGILMRQGSIVRVGSIEEVIDEYLREVEVVEEITFPERTDVPAYFTRLCIRDSEGRKTTRVPHSQPFVGEIEYVVRQRISSDRLLWMLRRNDGVEIVGSWDVDSIAPMPAVREPGRYRARVLIPGGILNEGLYQYRVAITSVMGLRCDYQYGNHFEIYNDSDYAVGQRYGVLLLRAEWSEDRID